MYPGNTPQVITAENVWQDIKPATDISDIKMKEFKFKTR